MTPILIDSDILIEVIRGKNGLLVAQWQEIANSARDIFISPVSIAELWQGARPYETENLALFFEVLNCTSIDKEVGRLAGIYLSKYRKSHNLAVPDALIAAGAVLQHAFLWTRNRKHYPMPDLTFY